MAAGWIRPIGEEIMQHHWGTLKETLWNFDLNEVDAFEYEMHPKSLLDGKYVHS